METSQCSIKLSLRAGFFSKSYLLKKSVMGRATSTASLAFFLPGVAFCAAAVPSPSAASLPAAALLPFAASLQIPYVCTMSACMYIAYVFQVSTVVYAAPF